MSHSIPAAARYQVDHAMSGWTVRDTHTAFSRPILASKSDAFAEALRLNRRARRQARPV